MDEVRRIYLSGFGYKERKDRSEWGWIWMKYRYVDLSGLGYKERKDRFEWGWIWRKDG